LNPGSDVFGDVVIDGITFTLGGTMTVKGDLSFVTTIAGRHANGGVFDVAGNLSFSNIGHDGTSSFKLSGDNSTIARSSTNMPSGTITVAKNPGQSVTLASNLSLNAGQSIDVASGTIDIGSALNALAISGGGSLTLSSGTIVKLSGGEVTVDGVPLATGSYSGGTIVP
jgi:hypothetical protein